MPHSHDSSHLSAHTDPHAGVHAGEGYAARKHPEFVVLEIGEELGALIVHTDPDMHGVEIEISPEHDHRHRSHKQVLERSINGRPAFTAVFDGLSAGTYTLWRDGQTCARVAVAGGSVSRLDWGAPDDPRQAAAPPPAGAESSAPPRGAGEP
jgi:hypothetical protein